MTLLKRLTSPGPKRILALDGGGVRGALLLGFIESIERVLRTRHRKPDLRLCDYFDLIGGTSVGAIIGSGLALGMEAAEIRGWFLELGGKVFRKKRWRSWKAFFDEKPLEEELIRFCGDLTSDLLTSAPALTYLRYNVWLEDHGLQELALTELVPRVESLRDMSAGENRHDLATISEKAAELQVRDGHFPPPFDLAV